ncbi:MAG: MBL fold metallo-hydrolase [Nevskia sp.]|nr:MBL fold metallo-hydrolase [Nevskia sp.]
MIRFAMLGSGSKGNSAVIGAGRTRVLLDCGLPLAETEARLQRLGLAAEDLDAVVVTHEHADHLSGVARLAQRYRLPVWLTPGTRKSWREAPDADLLRHFSPHQPFAIGDLAVEPFPVPHDAREPCQYVFGDGAFRVGVLSDAGSVTPHMRAVLSGCHALLVEFNHDGEMLARGPYPAALKRRVAGDRGHLSNAQAAALLAAIDCSRLRHLVLIHLSEINNTPELARRAAAAALNCTPDWIACAHQERGLDWCEVK